MIKRFGDYIVLLLSILGSLASILAFGIYFKPTLDNQGWVGVAFLGVLAVIFLFHNYFLIYKYRESLRLSKYAFIFNDLNIAFSHLHRIERDADSNAELIIQELSSLCDYVSSAFGKINGNEIGVSIKYLTYENKRPKVETLARDKYSKTNGRKTGKSDKIKHWLDSNSDFDFIYFNFEKENIDSSFYYESSLPTKKGYLNTRLDRNWFKENKIPFLENYLRRKNWPLKYRSTRVVPIIPIDANEQKQQMIRGFLCIDSSKEKMFSKNIDVHILRGISDGLYNKIDKLHKLIQNNERT